MDGVEVLKKVTYKNLNHTVNSITHYSFQAGVVDYEAVTEAIADKFVSLGGDMYYFENNLLNCEPKTPINKH